MPYLSQDETADSSSLSSLTSALLHRVLEEAINANSTEYNNDAFDAYDTGYEKKSKGPVYLDYSVLSIGILTLGLVLFVEIARHWIDHQAHGKPFFNSVLLMLYSELATLGIVEFAVFVLIKYYTDLDKEKKEVFGDVHFALFYTAVFNAIQSTLTAMFTRRASTHLWVQTEMLELDHYVEIREEYDRVQELIGAHQARNRVDKWIRNIFLFVRRPGLRGKFNNLRVQVRFHELRLQFLETHNLPLNLKVSDYLKRSELGVLIGLVHISGTAWLFLTGGLALLYFILGMVGYQTGDIDVLGSCMTGVFFGLLFLFIIVSIALQFKMERIFQSIMKMKINDSSDYAEGMVAQTNLFWFGSPSLVVSFIQFMNFGYAIALAVVIMYWPYLTLVEPYWYLIAVFGCYFIFLYNLAVLLPQFTLCTSLGYLANQKQLQETVAHHRLEEAKRQQRRKMIEKAIKNDSVIVLATHDESTKAMTTTGSSGAETPSTVASVLRSTADGIIPVDDPKVSLLADLVKSDTTSLRNQLPTEAKESLLTREQSSRTRRSKRKKAVSEGVAAMRALSGGSASGPLFNFQTASDDAKANRKNRIESRRHARNKSMSQPGLIKGWQDITDAEREKKKSSKDDADAENQRLKSNSESGIIKVWQDSQSLGSSGSSSSGQFKAVPEGGPKFVKKENDEGEDIPKWKKERAARLADRRQARKKTQSASAVIQSWQDYSVKDHEPGKGVGFPLDVMSIHSEESTEKEDFTVKDLEPVETSGRNKHNHVSFAETDEQTGDEVHANAAVIVDLADAIIVEEEGETLPAPPSKTSRAGTHTDDEAEDTESVASDKSIGNLSDVDIFEPTRGFSARSIVETVDPVKTRLLRYFSPSVLIRDARLYFLGSSYPPVSHVFGTLIVFFIIGHRVEAFVAKSGFIIQVDSFGWATNLLNMYWSVVVWLTCFVIADLMILMLFPLRKCKHPREKTLAIAAVIDLLLTGTVMILLFVAEAQRCCKDDANSSGTRMLADKIGLDYEFEDECTCGRWGSRMYSGLGIIEPFISIIALRIFRFVLAARLVQVQEMDKTKLKETEESSQDTDKDQSSDPHSQDHGGHGHDDHGHSHGHGHGGATVLELWEGAIAQYPEIVEKYGQFSGELLQAMLGLDVDVHSSEDVSMMSQPSSDRKETREEKGKAEDTDKPDTWQSHIKLTGTQYAKLPPEVQGLIIAGRLGKPVKLMNVPIEKNLSSGLLPTVEEGTTDLTHRRSTGLAEFEVDKEKMDIEHHTDFTFIAPFARLVRSMRRCDRRHLPLLTNWVSVDVVMTQFEIVYFESKDGKSSQEEEALKAALHATKGGKGLRLCDVVQGRKVVGHLDLADVTEVHVEQDEGVVSDLSLLEKAAERYHSKNDLAMEYWLDSSKYQADTEPKRFARGIRWTIMKEERLRLTTVSGTLVLRFYSDLECAELDKIENTSCQHSLSKDIALQWAETVSRICGPEQLQQELPHFAQDNEEELLDLLEAVPFHSKEAEKARKNRGHSELQYLYGEGADPSTHISDALSPKMKKSVLGRPKSFVATDRAESERPAPRPRSKGFRRSVSMGAAALKAKEDDDDDEDASSLV